MSRRLSEFIPIFISFYANLLIIRFYEYNYLDNRHALNESSRAVWSLIRGSLFEIYYVSIPICILFVCYFAFRVIGKSVAFYMTLGVGTLILLSTVALTEYFTITLDPLGAEVFEYGPSEIVKTARTSVDFSASHVAPYALVAFGFSGGALGISYVLPTGTKSHISKVGYGVAVWILLGISVVLWAAPREEDFIGPSYFHIFNNKLVLFAHEIQSDMGNSSSSQLSCVKRSACQAG